MWKNMESKPTTPSVLARLMGLEELSSQQPVKKQKHERVLSENYLRKVASIGVQERRSCYERRSFRFSIKEQKEFKDAFEVMESLDRDRGRVDLIPSPEKNPSLSESFADVEYIRVGIKLQPLKEVHSGQSELGFVESRKDCFEIPFQKPDYLMTKHFYDQDGVCSQLQSEHVRFLESSYAFHREKTDGNRKAGGGNDQENPKLLKKLENCFVNDSQRKYGSDSTCMVPRLHLESNNERRPSFRKTVILKPKPREVENASNCLSSTSSSGGSFSGNRRDKGFLSHGKGNSHARINEMKNFSSGVKSAGHRSTLSGETEKEIFGKTRHNISNTSLEPSRSGFSGVHSFAKEPEFMMVSSPNYSDLDNRYKPSCYYLDGSYVALEAKKQISGRWRMSKEFPENGLTIRGRGRSRTLGEMLALSDHGKRANSHSLLGTSSRDGWKNMGVGGLIKSRSPAHSTSVESAKIWTDRKALRDDYMTMRPMFSLNRSRLKSSKQGPGGKDGPERRNSGSISKKSQSSHYLESEKNHLPEDKYVIHNTLKDNLEKQDSFKENSMVSKSLKNNTVHSDSENKITPIDQTNDVEDGNMSAEVCVVPDSSMCTAASPSVASDVLVTTETVGVGKSAGNHNQQPFESTGRTMSEKDYDSSFCVADASSQQEDVSMKKYDECRTDPDFLLNLETAYHPSPVSVLEAPFEEILSSSKCLQSVTASLHDVRRQLEFLKSEPLKGYSEGPGMVVSTDVDDNDDDHDHDTREESLKDCAENEDLARSFGAEELWDFSYLVDALTEAGFCSKNQDIGFNGWHSPEIPISPSVFETLEKKYGEQISWNRSTRRLLFDRINSGLTEILRPCIGEPMWAKPVARRLSHNRQNLNYIEEELYIFLVNQEKEARKDSSDKVFGKDDGWLFLGHDIEVIGREIENSLIDDLVAEIVSLQRF